MPQLSEEVRAIVGFAAASKVPHRIASTYRLTATRHGWPGTNGWGLAVDVAGPRPGRDTPELKAVFDSFWLVRHQLRELYYSGPGVTHNVRHGMVVPVTQIPNSIRQGHHDHVHISVTKGTFIQWPGAITTIGEAMASFPNAIDACLCPTGGVWVMGTDGGVGAYGGAPFLGSYPGLKPEDRKGIRHFLAIQATDKGYCLLADDGNPYFFPTGQ